MTAAQASLKEGLWIEQDGSSDPDGARVWQSDAFEAIKRGLCAGYFGGVAFDEPAARTMTSLLSYLGWKADAVALAKAMPHFPDAFDIGDLQTVLSRLGYSSHRFTANLTRLAQRDLPALCVTPSGLRRIVIDQSGDDLVVLDNDGAQRLIARRDLRGVAYTFARRTDDDEPEALRGLLKGVSKSIRSMFIITFAANVLALFSSLAIMAVFDAVIPAKAVTTLYWIAGGAAFALSMELALRFIKARMIGDFSGEVENAVGRQVLRRVLGLPLEMSSGVAVSAQLAQVKQFEALRDAFTGPFAQIGLDLPFLPMFLIAIAIVAGPLVLVPVGLLLFFIAAATVLAPEMRRRAEAQSMEAAERDAQMVDLVSQLRVIRAMPETAAWRARAEEATRRAAVARQRQSTFLSIVTGLASAATGLATVALMFFGARSVIAGDISGGALVAVFIFSWRVFSPMQQAFVICMRAGVLLAAFRRLNSFFQLKQEARPSEGLNLLAEGDARIDLTEVAFRYPKAPAPALAGVTLTIDNGEAVMVTGPSGSGKTTLLRLMLGLYRPISGSVAIGGVEMRLLNLEDLRSRIGVVPSSPTLFHGTIAQNLRLAAPVATDVELEAVCHDLGLTEQLAALPEGLETRITDFSKLNVANGLGKMLALAQVLLRNPRILLLDDPASGLDEHQEQAFLRALRRLRGKATIVIVSQRPSHAKEVDRVVVLNRGRVAAAGLPDEMLAAHRRSQASGA